MKKHLYKQAYLYEVNNEVLELNRSNPFIDDEFIKNHLDKIGFINHISDDFFTISFVLSAKIKLPISMLYKALEVPKCEANRKLIGNRYIVTRKSSDFNAFKPYFNIIDIKDYFGKEVELIDVNEFVATFKANDGILIYDYASNINDYTLI